MILLTGASGFLGRHLVSEFSHRGAWLRAVVRAQSDVAFLREQGVQLAPVTDIGDRAALKAACGGCRTVIHAAGHFRMWGNLCRFWETNVGGTDAVLRAALEAGVQRVVVVSTVVVAGRTMPGRVVDETHPCRPQDAYQRTKWEAERLALAYARNCDLDVVIVRPGALYGPWGRYAFNRLFFEDPLRGWRIKVNGGRHVTFPVFVPDVARAILLALKKGRPGQIYNISGESLSHNAVNATVSALAGISPWRLNVPTAAVLALAHTWTALSRLTRREPFYPINMVPYVFQDWSINSQKAQTELGFTPTPFVDGAQTTLEWYWQQGILKRKT